MAHGAPLWLDETWTAAIVSAPDWRSFWREVYLDVNAPLYYFLMRLWTSVFGLSNFALRLPGLLAVMAAAAIPLTVRVKGLSFEARLTWAALLFFWWRVGVFLDARCYGLLLALSTLQCVLFAWVLIKPSRKIAAAWCAVAVLSILTQYYALFVGVAQGLVFLTVRRERALRCWPAALVCLPALAWIAHHAPRVAAYADPTIAWHPAVDGSQALSYAGFVFGADEVGFASAVAFLLAAAVVGPRLLRLAERDEPEASAEHLWQVVTAGVIAFVMAIIVGVVHESLTPRYLIPVVPSAMLCVVLCARSSRRAHLAYLFLITLYLSIAIQPNVVAASRPDRPVYGAQLASEELMRDGVTDVVFVWDHEVTRILDPGSLRRLGEVFFRRAGYPVRLTPLIVTPQSDVSRMILDAASGPRPGAIWIFNRGGRTAAARQRPRIAQIDPHWSCREISNGTIGALACYKHVGQP
jgi:hypothetical protein